MVLNETGRSSVPISMGRSRHKILEAGQLHFLTCTVVEWLSVFTRPGFGPYPLLES
jgi:hypothetical protein